MSSGRIVQIIGAVIDVEFPRESVPSELDGNGQGGKRITFAEGQEYDFRVLRINATDKKIGLSMKEAGRETARAAGSAPASKQAPNRKERPTMTTMAQAFSSAGIVMSPEPSDVAAPAAETAEKN